MPSVINSPLDYPFEVARRSFVVANSTTTDAGPPIMVEHQTLNFRDIRRLLPPSLGNPHIPHPVGFLTCGSNASAKRLSEKLARSSSRDAIALRLSLPDWIPVYAATLSFYGSVPATFVRLAGKQAEPFLVVMDRSNLPEMVASEQRTGNYDLCTIESGTTFIRSDFPVFAFVAKHGPLILKNTPVAVPEFQPGNGQMYALSQRDLISILLKLTGRSLSLDQYTQQVRDAGFLAAFRTDIRNQFGSSPDLPGWTHAEFAFGTAIL